MCKKLSANDCWKALSKQELITFVALWTQSSWQPSLPRLPRGPSPSTQDYHWGEWRAYMQKEGKEKTWKGWSPAHYWLTTSVMQLAPDKTATVHVTQGSWLVPHTGCSSLPHLLLAPHTEMQKFSQCGCNRVSFLYSDTALFHRFTSWPKNSPNCRRVV